MKLWVIKIGTSVLRGNEKFSTKDIIYQYCKCITEFTQKGDRAIIVSSGAVGLGCLRLKLNDRPKDIHSLQAIAAIGQGYLMSLYQEYMGNFGINVAQVLLTRSDFSSQRSYKNASITLKKLIDWNVIPIVNENDTISDEELKYGDNDTLSALVSTSVGADQLILLTDIDRLYSSDPRFDSNAIPISDVHNTNELIDINSNSNDKSNWGTGGIKTKLLAARIATEGGIKVQLADGRDPDILRQILSGYRGGTVFHPQTSPIGSKKSWLAHALHPQGSVYIDLGASKAITDNGASLLLVGVNRVDGNFNSNQPIRVIDSKGNEIARGISSLSSDFIINILDNHSNFPKSPIVIHRDVLVLLN